MKQIHSNKYMRWIFIFCLSILFHFLILIVLSNIKFNDVKLSSHNIPKKNLNITIINSKINDKKTKTFNPKKSVEFTASVQNTEYSKLKKTTIRKKIIKNSLVGNRKKVPPSSLKEIDLDSLSATITKVIEKIDEDDPINKNENVFDPRFRKKIELSRKEQKRVLKLSAIYRTKNNIEVLSRRETEMTLRVGNTCFNVPLENSFYPNDLQIMTFKLNCPKPELSALQQH